MIHIKMRRRKRNKHKPIKIQTQEITKEDINNKGTAKEMRFVQHKNKIYTYSMEHEQTDGGQ
jgi:hypothetical protein